MTGEKLEKKRKAKKYGQPKEQTLQRCSSCLRWIFDASNVQQRMSYVGKCKRDDTPADGTYSCAFWEANAACPPPVISPSSDLPEEAE